MREKRGTVIVRVPFVVDISPSRARLQELARRGARVEPLDPDCIPLAGEDRVADLLLQRASR